MANKVVLEGNLDFLNLGDVFQLLGSNGASGVLRITSRYAPNPGLIYFVSGNIINASNDTKSGLDAVYSLFGWTDADFEFRLEEVEAKRVVNANRMEIVLDGLRMLDEGEIPTLGPVSFEKAPADSDDDAEVMPLIRGPLVDHEYVIDLEDFSKGQRIVQEGKYGSWIWVILKGVVDIVKETEEGPLTMLRITEGAYVGSLASFLYQTNIRGATVTAANDVQLGVMDSQRLADKFSKMSPEFKSLLMSLDKRQREVTNCAVNLYLKKDRLEEFIAKKSPIIEQGESKQTASLIKEGEAYIARKTDSGYVPLARLTVGDFIGQVPFFTIGHEPLSASVFVSDDFEEDPIEFDDLQKEYDSVSQTIKNMIENIAISISVTTRLACDYQKKNRQEES